MAGTKDAHGISPTRRLHTVKVVEQEGKWGDKQRNFRNRHVIFLFLGKKIQTKQVCLYLRKLFL